MKKYIFTALAIATLSTSCTDTRKKEQEVLAQRFFDIYSQRKEIDKMESFYADKVTYENVSQSTGENVVEPAYLMKNILGFQDKEMTYDQNKMIKVKEILTNDSVIVASGEFSSYTYNGNKYPPMQFTTWLYLDSKKRIKKQVDWFNYPIEDIIELYQLQHSEKFKVSN